MVEPSPSGASARWHPGQLLFAGFEGTEAPSDLLAQIREGRVGGAILFARNIRDPAQVRRLVATLRDAAPESAPLVVAIDQEGGRVQRLREPWTRWPPMRRVGEREDLEATRSVATAIACELADLGIHLDFAPVVDVDSNPDNPIIGDRSFSRDPMSVARHGAAFIEALQAAGVAACAKHFPGHGDTTSDSHLELPRLELERDRLDRIELPPFAAAVEAGVASIMTAHVLFPRLDPKRPATLSPDVMGILRAELGYDGLIFSDDLEMKAVADHFSVEERTLGPLRAGVDSLLVCSKTDLRNEVLAQLEKAPDALLEQGIERMIAFKEAYGAPGVVPVASAEIGPPYQRHLDLADEF